MLTRFRDGLRPIFLLLSIAVVASGFAACGDGGDGGNADVKQTLETAFKRPIKRAALDISLELKLDGSSSPQFQQPVRARLRGPFESVGDKKLPKLDWDLTVSGAGQNLSAGVVSTGDNAFVSFQGADYEVGKELVARANSQLATQSGKTSPKTLADFGANPRSWITDEKDEGEEDVAGAKTTHVSGQLDVQKMIDDLLSVATKASASTGVGARVPKLTEQQRKELRDGVEKVIKDASFDVYVGKDDNTIRRLAGVVKFEIPEEDRKGAGGARGGTASLSIEFSKVGEAQTISAPSGAKPISELLNRFGGLGALGALGGGANGTTSPDSGSGSGDGGGGAKAPDQEQFKKYNDCVRKAKPDDPEAIQKCGTLLR